MAQQGPLTPEKQLLRLIEQPDRKAVGVQIHKIKHHGLRLFSLSALMGRFSFFRDSIREWLKGEEVRPFDNRILNRILIILISVVSAYFMTDVFLSVVRLGKKPDIEVEIKKGMEPEGASSTSLLKPLGSYSEQVRGRNIFEMGRTETKAGEKDAPPSEESTQVMQSLKLVGIAWSNDPDAMIEDISSTKTFFVKRGDMMGEFRVEAIFKNKVILRRGEEELELR